MRKRPCFFRRIMSVMNTNFSLLSVLQSHADQRGELLAHLLPDRDITYRRLWSRIERASARLQGEWNVQQGDVVAYYGNAHPDAIVLYFALLRIGALLLPLEGMSESLAQQWLQQAGARLVVHDDGLAVGQSFAQPLSMLLADWCHFDPILVKEDPALPALLLPQADGLTLQAFSLQQLTIAMVTAQTVAAVDQIIFTPELLSNIIFPALLAAHELSFSTVKKMLDAEPAASRARVR